MDANTSNPANWTTDEAVEFVAHVRAAEECPPEKRPLSRELTSPPGFPIEAMGPLMSAAVAIHNRTQAPLAMCAQSVLAAATLAGQAQRDIELPSAGRRPLTEFFVTIAQSGERKSSVDRYATAGIVRAENSWRQAAAVADADYANAKTAWDASRAHAIRTHKGDLTALKKALAATGPEPTPPAHPMLIVSDPTPEALTMHLATGRPMAGLFTDEGAQLLGGAAFNEESTMRSAALLNVLWDGGAIRRLRRSTGTTFLIGRRCSAHIMAQPVVAERLFKDEMIVGVGLLARMLVTAPDTNAGTRLFREDRAEDQSVLAAYNDRITRLLEQPLAFQTGSSDALDPPLLRFDDDARLEWIAFYNLCEQAITPAGPLSSIRPFASKLAEHAGRIAGILTIYHDPAALRVSLAAVQCAVQLATFYANEMLRLQGGALVSPDIAAAQKLLDWWREQPVHEQYISRLYQFGPPPIRDARTARKAVRILVEHGWLQQLPPGTVLDSKPRREAWRLVP